MQKNQKNTRTKKYRRNRNHAEFLDNIEFFGIILKSPLKLVYQPSPQEGFVLFCRYISSNKSAGIHIVIEF